MSKLRLSHFIVQPVLVVDDGTELEPGPQIGPQTVTHSGLGELVESWPEQLAGLQAEFATTASDDKHRSKETT